MIILQFDALNSERLTALSNASTDDNNDDDDIIIIIIDDDDDDDDDINNNNNNNKERGRSFCASVIPYETYGGVEVQVHTVLTPRDRRGLANVHGSTLTPTRAYSTSHCEQTPVFSVRRSKIAEGNSLAPSIRLCKCLEGSTTYPNKFSKNRIFVRTH
jgi:hypothetical protein